MGYRPRGRKELDTTVTNTHTLLLSWHVTHLREASRFCCRPIPGSPPSVSALFMSLLVRGLLTGKTVPSPPSYPGAPAPSLVHGA